MYWVNKIANKENGEICECVSGLGQQKFETSKHDIRILGNRNIFMYQKLLGIRPSWSIESFDSNTHLTFKLPFVDYIWSLFTMLRNYILHRKPRCSIFKLIYCVLMKCGQITNFTILLIFCIQTPNSHTAIVLSQQK